MHRLAIFASHPIQYQTPLFKAMARDGRVVPQVYFRTRGATEPAYDPEFGKVIQWDLPLLEGYEHSFLSSSFELPRLLFKKRFDGILVFGWNSFEIALIALAALFSGTPLFLRSESPWNQEVEKGSFLQQMKRIVLRYAFKMVAGFLFIGKENKEFYKQLGVSEKKLFFTPYAVDNDRLLREAEEFLPRKDNIRQELGLPTAKKVILFVGKLIPKKNPMDLLLAFGDLSREDVALVFVGEGMLRPALEKTIREKNIEDVHFAGFKNMQEIGRYYAAADFFVLPSGQGETWGLVANEAMCFGLPIILSRRVGSASDLVEEDRNGYTFRLGNVSELRDALLRLIEEPKKCEEFGRASRAIVERYSFEADIEGISRAIKNSARKV